MPYPRPTLIEIVGRNESDAASRLGLPELPRRSVEAVLVRTNSGGEHLMYGYLDYAHRQRFIHLCGEESLPDLAYLHGVPRKRATFAAGAVVFAGVNGSVVPAGTEVQRADGTVYVSTADAAASGGVVELHVDALAAGADANASAGTAVSLISPVAGVQSSGQVAGGGIAGGLDEEDAELWRGRILERVQHTPHAGNLHDFEEWAKEVPGVTRAWAYKEYIPGQSKYVYVAFVCDDTEGGPIPTPEKVAEVLAHLDEKCSATAHPVPFAPAAVSLDFDIRLSPDTAAVRAAVELELRDLLLRDGKPDTTIPLSHVREAISIAPGEYDFAMTVPGADIVIAKGEFPIFGTITWE